MVARLQAATKNANATLLLMRVIFWSKQKNGGVELEGHRWVVNALEEWADETGLTRHQVKEAIAALREMNLVATKMAWWHNRWVMHSRLTPRTTAILEGGSAPIGTPLIYRESLREIPSRNLASLRSPMPSRPQKRIWMRERKTT